MPYITSESVKEKRDALKKEFPEVKFSVTRRDMILINVIIRESPFEIGVDEKTVNTFHIERDFKTNPELVKFLLKVKEIIDKGNEIEVVDSDYGAVPCFYTNIAFGDWERPYKCNKK
jgi:hypothetical protein